VYEWLAESDATQAMMGPPLFPDVSPPTWEEFCADYGEHFFAGSRPEVEMSYIVEVDGVAIGHVNYEVMGSAPRTAELDIWLRSEGDCGRGCGPDALRSLTRSLAKTYGIREFILRPSARNARAITAYAKAGFRRLSLSPEQQTETYGSGDYADSVVMRRRLPE